MTTLPVTAAAFLTAIENAGAAISYTSRSSLVTWAASNTPTNGQLYAVGDLLFIGSTGATAISDLPGLLPVENAPEAFGAVGNDTADDTVAIQKAINYAFSLGGGEVHLRKDYALSATAETDTFYTIASGPAVEERDASDFTCLVLRSGVTLVLHDGAKIRSTDTSLNVVTTIDMNGGGIVGAGKRGKITSGWTSSGAGHGIFLGISDAGEDNVNLTFDNLEIYSVGSYGIGAQYGDYLNNRYTNLHIHDTGADGIDHKVRLGTTNTSRGVFFDNILIERQGRRSGITASAGIDVRGPAILSNIVVRDFALSGQGNVGLRLSSGTYNAVEEREPSSRSALTNFFIDNGDPSIDGDGLVVLSSEETTVSNGVIIDCNRGVDIANASSGVGNTCRNASINGVTVIGAWDEAFFSNSERVTLANCRAVSQNFRYSEDRGNLAATQTTFETDRPFDSSTVEVYKNGSALTLTTDYTVTDDQAIELVSGVLVSDEILIVTPTATGFDIDQINNTTIGCRTDEYVTTPLSVSVSAADTFMEVGCDFNSGSITLRSGTTPFLQVIGASANYDLDLRAKGTGGVTLRSQGDRALRAINPSSSAVNWMQVSGSETGDPVEVSAQGSDTNIDLFLEPKGTGRVRIGTHASIGAETVTGYIEIKDAGGTVRKLAVVS